MPSSFWGHAGRGAPQVDALLGLLIATRLDLRFPADSNDYVFRRRVRAFGSASLSFHGLLYHSSHGVFDVSAGRRPSGFPLFQAVAQLRCRVLQGLR